MATGLVVSHQSGSVQPSASLSSHSSQQPRPQLNTGGTWWQSEYNRLVGPLTSPAIAGARIHLSGDQQGESQRAYIGRLQNLTREPPRQGKRTQRSPPNIKLHRTPSTTPLGQQAVSGRLPADGAQAWGSVTSAQSPAGWAESRVSRAMAV